MFANFSDMTTEIKTNVRGGTGAVSFRHLLTREQLGERADLVALLTLEPGTGVGEHPHVGNGEAYVMVSGSATVTEDGVARVLNPGDAEFCADGHTHSIFNHTDETATFLALIVRDR